MKRFAAAALVATIAAAGCGDDSTTSDRADQPQSNTVKLRKAKKKPACVDPSPAAVRALEQSIQGDPKLTDPRAFKSSEKGGLPGFERNGGLHFLAATQGDRQLLWAVNGEFLKTGGGLAVGVDPNTRKVSELGADVPLETAGVSMSTPGVTEALTGCA